MKTMTLNWCQYCLVAFSLSWQSSSALKARAPAPAPSLLRGVKTFSSDPDQRFLQDCTSNLNQETAFNNDKDVVTHTGLMFEIEAGAEDITLTTMEIDVKSGLGNNLAVDVYVTNAAVVDAFGNRDQWSLVAQTRLVLNPEGVDSGALIPTFDFKPVPVQAGSRKSIYLRMKGPYVDNTIRSGINRPNQIVLAGDHMDVYSAYMIRQTDPEFPTTLRDDEAPVFAGRLHYSLQKSCNAQSFQAIEVEFAIVIDVAVVVDDFNNVEQSMNSAVNTLLRSDEKLSVLVNEEGLKMGPVGTSAFIRDYTGTCPPLWAYCVALISSVPLEFSTDISEGRVKEEIYKHTGTFSQAMLEALREGTQGAYVGLQSMQSFFTIELQGVSQTDVMDEVQGPYFEERLVSLSNEYLSPGLAQVFRFEVQQQQLFDIDSIRLEGKLFGAILSIYTSEDFAGRTQFAIKENLEQLAAEIKFFQLYPGPMAEEGRAAFFGGLEEILSININGGGGTAQPTSSPTPEGGVPVEDDDDGIRQYVIYAAIGLGGLLLLCVVFCCCRSMMNQRDKAQERKIRKMEAQRSNTLIISNGDPPKSIGVDNDQSAGLMPRRMSKKSGRSGSARRLVDHSEGTFFEDEHSLGGSTIETRENSFRLKRAGSLRSLGRGNDDYINPGNRRASHAGFARGTDFGRSSNRRASHAGFRDRYDDDFGDSGHSKSRRASVSNVLYAAPGMGVQREEPKAKARRASTGYLSSEDEYEKERPRRRATRRASTGSMDGSDDDLPKESGHSKRKSKRRHSHKGLGDSSHHSSSHHSSSHKKSSRRRSSHHRSSSKRSLRDDDTERSGSNRSLGSDDSPTESSRGIDDPTISETFSKKEKKSKKKKKSRRKSTKHIDEEAETIAGVDPDAPHPMDLLE